MSVSKSCLGRWKYTTVNRFESFKKALEELCRHRGEIGLLLGSSAILFGLRMAMIEDLHQILDTANSGSRMKKIFSTIPKNLRQTIFF